MPWGTSSRSTRISSSICTPAMASCARSLTCTRATRTSATSTARTPRSPRTTNYRLSPPSPAAPPVGDVSSFLHPFRADYDPPLSTLSARGVSYHGDTQAISTVAQRGGRSLQRGDSALQSAPDNAGGSPRRAEEAQEREGANGRHRRPGQPARAVPSRRRGRYARGRGRRHGGGGGG